MSSDLQDEKSYFEVKDLSKRLNKDESTIRKLFNKGEIPALRKGSKNRITTDYALAYSNFIKTNRANLDQITRKAKTIAITNNKGGAAKTTTAVNMAALLWDIGNSVLLVDIDSQGNATQYAVEQEINEDGVELPFPFTIKDILLEQKKYEKISEAAFERTIKKSRFGFDVLPCDIRLNSIKPEIESASMREVLLREVIRQIQTNYDYVIIDTPPTLGIEQTLAYFASDYVLIVANPAKFSKMGIEQTYALLQSCKHQNAMYANPKPIEVLGVLITNADMQRNVDKYHYSEISIFCKEMGIKLFDEIIKKKASIEEALTINETIFNYDGASETALAYFDAFLKIDERIKKDRIKEILG